MQIVPFFHEWNRLQGSEKSVQLQLAPTLRHQACGNVNFHRHHAAPFLPKPFPSCYTSAHFSSDTLALVEISQTSVGKEIWSCMRELFGGFLESLPGQTCVLQGLACLLKYHTCIDWV